MHVAFPFGIVVAAIEIWIALSVMAVLALVAPGRRAAKVSSLTIATLSWMCVCGALRFLP
jgi:hypothetical protein